MKKPVLDFIPYLDFSAILFMNVVADKTLVLYTHRQACQYWKDPWPEDADWVEVVRHFSTTDILLKTQIIWPKVQRDIAKKQDCYPVTGWRIKHREENPLYQVKFVPAEQHNTFVKTLQIPLLAIGFFLFKIFWLGVIDCI